MTDHLADWIESKTTVVIRGTVTMPFAECKIVGRDIVGLSVELPGGARHWIPFTAITYIGEA